MYTFNLFKRPFERSTLEAWAKQAEDTGRIAFVAFFAMIFSSYDWLGKAMNSVGLFLLGYVFMLIGRNIRLYLINTKET